MKAKGDQMRELAVMLVQCIQKKQDIKRQINLICRKIEALNYDMENEVEGVEDV